MRSTLRMCRPIGGLLGLHWQGLGRGVLWKRNQAQARGAGASASAGAGAGAGESRAVESRAHVTGGGGKRTVLSKWGVRRAEA